MMDFLSQHWKHFVDGIAVTFAAASIMKWAPPIAAILSCIWLTIQIGDWVYKKLK